MRHNTTASSSRAPLLLLAAVAFVAASALQRSLTVNAAAIASINFKNQCEHAVNVFEGNERFCDVRAGSKEAPAFGCATHLKPDFAIYSHGGGRNATKARFYVDTATNVTYYELSDQPAKNDPSSGFNVGLMIYPMQFENESVGATSCQQAICTYRGCPGAYHASDEPSSNKTSGCPNGADFVLIFCP